MGKREGTLTETARRSRSGAPSAGAPALPGRRRRRLPLGAEAQRDEASEGKRGEAEGDSPHRGMYTGSPLRSLN